MADVTINISTPVLLANQGFHIFHNEVGGMPVDDGIFTTNNPTITGLTPGICYIFTIRFLQSISPLVECAPKIFEYCLPEVLPCVTFTGTLEQSENVWKLTIDINLPSPYSDPCGGYRVEYGITAPYANIYITSFLTSPSNNPLILPASNNTYHVAIYAIGCDESEILCDDATIVPESEGCIHANVLNAEILFISGIYYVRLTVSPSIPGSITYGVSYSQSGAMLTGIPDPGGSITFNGTGSNPEIFTFPINPNFNVQVNDNERKLHYQGGLTDGCNWITKWEAQYVLS